MDIVSVVFIIIAFIILWLGSSLIVDSISAFAHRLTVPPFVFSFFIVGFLTSIGEIAVAINAIKVGQPEIFVGSLLGSTLVIFSLVIPLTALLARGLHIRQHINGRKLFGVLAIIAAPAWLALDRQVGNLEALLLIALYGLLFLIVRSPRPSLKKVEAVFEHQSNKSKWHLILRLILGGIALFIASHFIVEETIVISEQLHVSAFMISLVVVAIGMSLPEFSLAIKAGRSRDSNIQDIAIGDFLGSAAANVAIFGIFAFLNDGDVTTSKSFGMAFIYIILALVGFYIFTRGRSKLTSKESVALMSLYALFIFSRIVAG